MKNILKAAVAASLIVSLSGAANAQPAPQAQGDQAAKLAEAHAHTSGQGWRQFNVIGAGGSRQRLCGS